MDRQQEFEIKLQRIRSMMESHKLDAVILSRRSNFAWLTGGGANHVGVASDFGAGSLIIQPDRVLLRSSNIESARLLEEECAGLPLVPWVHDWYDTHAQADFTARVLAEKPYGSDGGPWNGVDLTGALMKLRHPLLPPEVERYRCLGVEAESVMSGTCQELHREMSEYQVAGLLAAKCLERGIESTVRLVAFDERISLYRHPIPTAKILDQRALVVLGARRHGLTVSLSRMVCLGRIDGDLRRKHDAVCRIDAVLNLQSTNGNTIGDILQKGIAQYEREGFPEEWKLHHQGGLTGYEGRDFLATIDNTFVLRAPTAVAWNPSITGTKSEDTFLVTEDGVENLTEPKDWPMVRVETDKGVLERCDIWER